MRGEVSWRYEDSAVLLAMEWNIYVVFFTKETAIFCGLWVGGGQSMVLCKIDPSHSVLHGAIMIQLFNSPEVLPFGGNVNFSRKLMNPLFVDFIPYQSIKLLSPTDVLLQQRFILNRPLNTTNIWMGSLFSWTSDLKKSLFDIIFRTTQKCDAVCQKES